MLSISEGAAEGQPFSLLPWHTFAAGSLFGWRRTSGRMRFRTAWLETGKGQAKALALDTPIPTPTGWTTMGEIRDGDAVLDETGAPCRVTRAHDVLLDRECYRLTFDDGAQIIADAGHLWRTEMRWSGRSGHGDATRGVSLGERGGWRYGLRTTAEIAGTLRFRNGRFQSANHSIALAGALDLPTADLPIAPYALGFWLGDGDADGARVTIGDRDAAESIRALAVEGVTAGPRRHGGSVNAGRYGLVLATRPRDGFGARLAKLGLLKNKHIPLAYLRAGVEQRLALLQGLMDTDGTVAVGGQCSFCNTNQHLAEAVLELALSLGLKATLVEKSAMLRGRRVGASYHVNFYASGIEVFRLRRKQARVGHSHRRRRLSADRKIVACDRVASVPVRCISVDSPSQMFLCGRAMIPTHNSPFMAAIGVYMTGFYGVKRAKAFAIGQDKNTANVLFKDAVAMCRGPIPGAEPDEIPDTLVDLGYAIIRGEGDNAWKIEFPANDGLFQSLANGEAISGPKPTLVAADEIHEFKSNTSIEIWKQAIAKMPGDALMLLGTNTPSTSQIVGTEYSEYFQKVARGDILDDEAFAFIARVDKVDRENIFDTPAVWSKALPALGITFPLENVEGMVRTAKQLLSTALSTKRLYFGIPIGATEFWIAEEAWSSVQGVVDELKLKGCRCWLSLDLSQKNDLTALSICWIDDKGHLWVKTFYWTTSSGLADRARKDQAPYDQWVEKGHLEAVPGATIDKTFVAMKVKELCAEHEVEFLAFDAAGMADFISACQEIGLDVWRYEGPDKPEGSGLKLVAHAQGTRRMFEERQLTMPTSIERLEDRILQRTITIDSSPVTYACAANAQIVADGQKNRAFDKKRSRGRIDGVVTIAMVVGAATMTETKAKRSFWDSDDFDEAEAQAQ
ncbi:MAG: hypothetical protein DI527_18855 [Chelatococcus sp.]|nr:MAG: hypothetical protein DI527_18855 [Chelatococcus sp.]